MNVVARVLLTAIVVAAGVRATATAVHAALDVPKRTSVYFTEPQMVGLARRVQQGERLYPDWRTYPHVVNVFTPGYFWLVGLLGRPTGASIEGLQWIARSVTLFFTILGAALAAWAMRRHGRPAIVAAACLVFGSGMTLGFGWMARPDLASDVLGFAGFLAATSAAPMGIATALLAAGMLCKQTAVVYTVAVAVALAWQGRRKRCVTALVGSAAGALAVLAMVYIAGERRVFSDVLLEASSPLKWDHWVSIASRLFSRCGDVVVLCLIGGVGWIAGLLTRVSEKSSNAKRWLGLLLVAAIFGGMGSAKFGSDVNYYMPLRFVSAAALAQIMGGLRSPSNRTATVSAALLALAAILLWTLPVLGSLRGHAAINPVKRAMTDVYEKEIHGVAALSKTKRILTNSDDIALRIDNPFVDSFLFKMLVDTGRLQPTVLEERLSRGEYDLVVTTGSFDDPRYLDSAFALPRPLAKVINERYMLVSQSIMTYYRPKREAGDVP